jgi:hypothetical protein
MQNEVDGENNNDSTYSSTFSGRNFVRGAEFQSHLSEFLNFYEKLCEILRQTASTTYIITNFLRVC